MHVCKQLVRVSTLFLFLLLVLTNVYAITVTPETQQLTDPQDETYTFVYSVRNDDPQPRSLTLRIEPFSEYLRDQVSFSKEQFALLPSQTENVQVVVHPRDLGPETHTLKVGVYDGTLKLTSFELHITVPGTPTENYELTATSQDTSTDAAVPVSVVLANYGNIIGYARLTLTIERSGQAIGSVSYPELIQVLPGKKVSYDLLYTDALSPGFYTARVSAAYPTEVLVAEDQFSVRLEETKQRIERGSDLILTFASLGNPSAIQYRLLDDEQKELAQGTFVPQGGDAIVPMHTLEPGTYHLYLRMQGDEQHITVIISDGNEPFRILLIVCAGIILLGAVYSYRDVFVTRVKLFLLQRAVHRRQAQVTNLINRSHRLVDQYTALHASRQQRSGTSRTTDKRLG
jgi:hypothetical protein